MVELHAFQQACFALQLVWVALLCHLHYQLPNSHVLQPIEMPHLALALNHCLGLVGLMRFVRTYVVHMLRTYVILYCNWLIF